MEGEWPLVTVESIAARTASGPFGSNLRGSEYVEIGVPVIRGGNLSGPRFTDEGYVYVTDAKAESLSSSLAYPLDIVFAARGSIGAVGLVPQVRYDRYLLSSNLVKITLDSDKADPRFVFYYFRSWHGQQEILAHVNTTGVPKIERALESLRTFRIPRPPLNIQRAIACILGTLDDKIEMNSRMNLTLEKIAHAIFKSWFVDFDLVRAKAAGGQPYGLVSDIAGLFPSELERSELGSVPKGWAVGTLDDLLVLQRGFDLPTRSRIPGQYQVIAASGPSTYHNEAKVQGPGVVTGRSGVLGKVFLVQDDFWPLNTTLWVKEFRGSKPYHAYFTLQRLDLAVYNAGSAVPTLNRNHIRSLPMVLPDSKVVDCFERFAQVIFSKINANGIQSATLSSLRDTLLPKLISGELRVPDAERIVERCA